MTYSWPMYIVLAIVAVVSFGATFLLPTVDILRFISGVPGLVALIGVILQIFRDQAQHEKALAIQKDQQHFILGVTSHMANVAFDKHVVFCEQYITHMQKVLPELLRQGPTQEGLVWRSELADIRLSYRAWLTSDIQDKILPFEEALSRIAILRSRLADLEVGPERTKVVHEMNDTYATLLGFSNLREARDEDVAAREIMDHLQDILGVKQLVRLRIKLVDEAVNTLEKKG